MLELLRVKKSFVITASICGLVALLAISVVAQTEDAQSTDAAAQVAETADAAQTAAPAMSSSLADSFLAAPNDSAEVAAGIAEMIRKERSGFINRVKRSGVGQNYIAGGFFMHLLLTCSIVALVFIKMAI